MATTFYPTYQQAYGPYGGGNGGAPAPSIPFFKIAGQSNAQGLARRSDLYSATLNTASPSFTRQFNTRIWNPTANALQRLQVGTAGKTGSGGGNELGQQGSEHPSDYEDGFGPEIGFAQRLEQQNTSTAVLAKFGRGATAIARWQKAAGDLYPLLKATIVNARAAVVASGNTPQELGLYWDQWETDGNSSTYQTDLQQFYNDLKADGLVGASEKFVVCAAQNNTILSQQQAFINANPAAVLLTPASIAYIPNDNLHYDARTQLAIGGNSLYNLLYNTTGSINIPAPATTTFIQDNDSRATQPNGAWKAETGSFYNGGTGLVNSINTALTVVIAFRGTGFTAYSPKAAGVGTVEMVVLNSAGQSAFNTNPIVYLGVPDGNDTVASAAIFDSGSLPLDDYTLTWRTYAGDGRPIFFDAISYRS